MKRKRNIKRKAISKMKTSKRQKKDTVCERYNEQEMCYRCLDIARSLLLCGELDEEELVRVRKIMVDIIDKRGVLKEEVVFLDRLSDEYLN